MGDFTLDSEQGSAAITLHPEWSFQQRQTVIRNQHRSQGGALQTYDWSNYLAFTVPLQFVSSADATQINSWWQVNDSVFFTMNTEQGNTTALCKIVNTQLPLNQFHQPDQTLWRGTLFLEAIDNRGYILQPFTLDDDVLGLLDQDYNGLS